jgi:5-methylcytosine-specific restriction endonuclease McrA
MSGLYAALPGRPDFDKSKYRLGLLCKRSHDWMGSGQSLRWISNGRCVGCERERNASRTDYCRQRYEANLEDERRKARERMAARLQDPEQRRIQNERTKACMAKRRATDGRESRSKNGLPYMFIEQHGFSRRHASLIAEMHAGGLEPDAIRLSLALRETLLRKAGKSPTVADLVEAERRRYLREHPEIGREVKRKAGCARKREEHRRRYLTDPSYRLYHRQKSKRRKAQMRNSVAIQITGRQVRARFAEFDHPCAYCRADGDLHIEHVVPISRGGGHALGNIVPACESCNYSKRDHDPEDWYRSQPQFSELRWRKICRVLGWQRSSVGQLALL